MEKTETFKEKWEDLKDYGKKIAVGGAIATAGIFSIGYDIENADNLLHVLKGYSIAFTLDVVSKYKNVNKAMSYLSPLAFEMFQEYADVDMFFSGHYGVSDMCADYLGMTIFYMVDNHKVNHFHVRRPIKKDGKREFVNSDHMKRGYK